MNNSIPIAEIFGPTIQGEGPNAGARCIFVRVAGCDFKCDFCDSKFTWSSSGSKLYSTSELAEELSKLAKGSNCNRIVLTGGNPCLYDFKEVINLVGNEVAFDIETQGSRLPEWLSLIDTVVFSPKPPSSNMQDTYDNIVKYLEEKSNEYQQVAIKIPVFDNKDIEFAGKYAKFLNYFTTVHDNDLKLYLSVGNSDVNEVGQIRDRVLDDYLALLNTINADNEDFNNVFILPQIHTLVWGNKQGV